MKTKLTALLLCLSLLLTASALTGCADSGGDSDAETLRVMYIPLDNRPINDQQVRLLAGSLGIELLMPPSGLYATALDGAVNEAGLQYGDRAALLEWMMENADACDRIVLYLDQLLSGGLMNSRCMEQMEPVTLSDGSVYTEYDIIDYVASLAGTHSVYVIDSQLRLAASNDYRGVTLEDYEICRSYGMVPRPQAESDADIETIVAAYPLAADGTEAVYAAELTQEQTDYFLGDGGDDAPLGRYLATRERKFRLNAYAIETLYALENVRYFFGVDDSAAGSNIQSAEYDYLNRLTGGTLENLSAIDCLGELALSCLFTEYSGSESVRVTVRYYGERDNSLNYAGHTVAQAVEQILAVCGAEEVTEGAEVEILVACDTALPEGAQAASDALIGQLRQNFDAQQPTIYLDFASSVNTDLVQDQDITLLLSAGLHGNGSGASAIMGISQGLARYRALRMEGYLDRDCHKAFIADMVFMFAKGYYWKSSYKSDMTACLLALELNPNNMTGATEEQLREVNDTLTRQINASSAGILQCVSGGRYISSLAPYAEGRIGSVAIQNCSYPWQRIFEFTADFTVRLK